MSTSTTTSTISPTVQTIVSTVESVVALAFAGKLTGISTTVQNEIKTLDEAADAKIVALRTALDAAETSNPYVQETITVLTNLAKSAGFGLPSEDQVFAGLKKVVDDLAGSVTVTAAA